jgi:uncharacterized membrane protein YphA (DoxX/SURF4 family)
MRIALAIVRTLVGLVFVFAGASKLFQHDLFAGMFRDFGIPQPEIAVTVVGAIEVVCGLLFALGALTRPVGLILATVMAVAAVTAGLKYPVPHLIVTSILFIALVFFAWRSGRYAGAKPARRPGVQ